MRETIFDLIEPSEDKKGYMEVAARAPEPKDSSFFDDIADYGKTFLKGAAEGLGRLGRVVGPTIDLMGGKDTQKQLEEQTENLERVLHTNEGFTQSAIRRGLRQAPTMAAFPGAMGQTLPRSAVAGFLGESAKELGLPEWAQTAAELTSYIGPDVTKKLIETGKHGELVKKARELGMSDETIAPLLNENFLTGWLTKLTSRRGTTEKVLSKTKSATGDIYNKIRGRTFASVEMPQEVSQATYSKIDKILSEMPRGMQNKIKADYADLKRLPMTADRLMNFFQDINYELKGSTKQLSLLKNPIREAIESVSPRMAKDFDTANLLRSKYYGIAKRLEPTIASDILSAAPALGGLVSLFTGYYPGLINSFSAVGGKKIAQQMLLNPRFKQIGEKMSEAVLNNRFPIVLKLVDLLKKEVGKIDKDAKSELDTIKEEELLELFSNPQQAEE